MSPPPWSTPWRSWPMPKTSIDAEIQETKVAGDNARPADQGAAAIEPDDFNLPVDLKNLRSGFTTGTAATAAAVAAARLLLGESPSGLVEVSLPAGRRLEVNIAQAVLINTDESMAIVVKDGGDDPDVTNGAEIGAIARRRSDKGLLHIIGGPGVGRVTKAGLAVPPGQWAINPGPMSMLRENLSPFLEHAALPGLEVEVFVEKGEELAPKTLNPRLGIVGGISILGTTGLVKPFSNEAYLSTIESALNQLAALGRDEVVLTTGRQSEKLIMALRPDLPEECFVQVADFFGASLKLASARGLATVGLAAFFGKTVKQAAGHFYTHAHHNDQDIKTLADWLSPMIDDKIRQEMAEALTARGALDILRQAGRLDLVEGVAERALASARSVAGSRPKLWMKVFDYDGRLLTGVRNG